MTSDRPNFFEIKTDIVCADCRRELLRDWGPGPESMARNEDETVRPSDFTNLGRTPWAGNPEEGGCYVQCSHCLGQWGPDA